jgi:hypothetical protein
MVIPSRDLVVVRLGHYKGEADGDAGLPEEVGAVDGGDPQSALGRDGIDLAHADRLIAERSPSPGDGRGSG